MVNLNGKDKARYVSGMFDKIAKHYDLMNTVMSGGMHHFWRKRATKLGLDRMSGEVLDVATGTGDFALEFVQNPLVERVIGLDFANSMIPIAKAKASNQGVSSKSDWVLGDALNLPFLDNRFICVTVGFGMRNFADKYRALEQMLRVLKPGGKAVILDIVPISSSGLVGKLMKLYFRGLVPILGAVLAHNKEAYTYLPESVEGYLAPKDLAQLMEHVGFDHITYGTMFMKTIAFHVGEKGSDSRQ
tara:strand:- start:279 stop:1013 length:735 start_codon:yes stop_codon:yes gene_type:complete